MRIFDPTVLRLPFFDDAHRQLGAALESWEVAPPVAGDQDSVEARVRSLARVLGRDGWLEHTVRHPDGKVGPDIRAIGLLREAFAYRDDLLDFVFSIQALAAAPILRYGKDPQKDRYLPGLCEGRLLGTFAISELESGSDVSGIQLAARPNGSDFVLSGTKAWIANANVADFHCVLARTGEGPGALGLSMFVVPAGTRGLSVGPAVPLVAPRPLAPLNFEECVLPAESLIGKRGHGFRYAMEILERFRVTVGAAAIGFSRRAMVEALRWSLHRKVGGGALFDMQMTKERMADMALYLDAAALLVARASWELDMGKTDAAASHTSMAKLFATEGAQQVVDRALQLLGAAGLVGGSVTEALYRQVRSLRIYEGTSEIQKLIIAGSLRQRPELQPMQ